MPLEKIYSPSQLGSSKTIKNCIICKSNPDDYDFNENLIPIKNLITEQTYLMILPKDISAKKIREAMNFCFEERQKTMYQQYRLIYRYVGRYDFSFNNNLDDCGKYKKIKFEVYKEAKPEIEKLLTFIGIDFETGKLTQELEANLKSAEIDPADLEKAKKAFTSEKESAPKKEYDPKIEAEILWETNESFETSYQYFKNKGIEMKIVKDGEQKSYKFYESPKIVSKNTYLFINNCQPKNMILFYSENSKFRNYLYSKIAKDFLAATEYFKDLPMIKIEDYINEVWKYVYKYKSESKFKFTFSSGYEGFLFEPKETCEDKEKYLAFEKTISAFSLLSKWHYIV